MEKQYDYRAAFLIVDGVYNSELTAPFDYPHHTIFHAQKGIQVFTIAPTKDVMTTFEGIRILPDYGFESADLAQIDILTVPSTEQSLDSDFGNERLIRFVRAKGNQAKYVISFCVGALVLAKAGLVAGYHYNTFPSDIELYKMRCPNLTDHEGVSFVLDRKLMTTAGEARSLDPSMYLVSLLYGNDVAKGVGKGMVIDWNIDDYQYVIVKDSIN
ncbi:MAG: transcriptional regulator GlxA family with amidase domain [Cyclobacteriaceae bacterium]|jgi:transcriptional regulator GlxA family with amidase domain